MKKIKFTLLTVVLALCSFTTIKTAITWKATEIDLGTIRHNVPAKIEFTFKNSGESPVIITNVQAGCGCTSVDYPRTPIAPGESSKISAVFNAAAVGAFKKTVTVTSSAEESPRVLSFTGTVSDLQ